MRKSPKSKGRAFLKFIQAFHTVRIHVALYIGCSDQEIGSSTEYMLIIFRPSTTSTIDNSNLHTATKWLIAKQTINNHMPKSYILLLIRIIHDMIAS